jgi:LAO/AO transport system kinase
VPTPINNNLRYQPADRPTAAELFAGLTGEHPRRALGRAITLLESTQPEDRVVADELVDLAQASTANASSFRLGISGTPGVGKSTFVESFGMEVVKRGHKLAVLAIDPSSSLSGGSILGDKTRMEMLSRHPEVFIRPSPTSGHLGGVGANSRAAVLLCEAAGYDYIVVETVGVGQAEWRVHSMTDAFLLLAQPGAGDDLQGIKRGILELADYIVVNKADRMPDAAKQAALELRSSLHLAPARKDGWTVKVDRISALTGDGIPNTFDHLADYHKKMMEGGQHGHRRKNQRIKWLKERVEQDLLTELATFLSEDKRTSDDLGRILDEHSSLSSAANVILAEFLKTKT